MDTVPPGIRPESWQAIVEQIEARGPSGATSSSSTSTAAGSTPIHLIGNPESERGPFPYADSGDEIGYSVSVDGDRMMVGAPGSDDRGENSSGEVYYFERDDSGEWVLKQRLARQDGTSDQFGRYLSLSGDTVAIGAPFAELPAVTGEYNTGVVFIFEYDGRHWNPTAELIPALTGLRRFGEGLALDGDLLLIGSPNYSNGWPASGIVFAYRRQGADWIRLNDLEASGLSENRYFGRHLDIQGTTALVGGNGEVWHFEFDGVEWTRLGRLRSTTHPDEWLGAMALDGSRAIVGAPGSDLVDRAAGAAFVFERSEDGWVDTAILLPDAAPWQSFGAAVDLEGDWLLVGAPRDDSDAFNAGSVSVYRLMDGDWNRIDRVHAINSRERLEFGANVIWADGEALVGSPASLSTGVVHVLRGDSAIGSWQDAVQLRPDPGRAQDWFGAAIGMLPGMLVVGAPGASEDGMDSGAVYVFELHDSVWELVQTLVPPPANAEGDRFGTALSLDEERLIVGAPYRWVGGRTGAILIYERSGGEWVLSEEIGADAAPISRPFGAKLAHSGDLLIVSGYEGLTPDWVQAGNATIFRLTADGAVVEGTVFPSDGQRNDYFGWKVAIREDFAAVATSRPIPPPGGEPVIDNVYIYRYQDGTWSESQILGGEANAQLPYFGSALDFHEEQLFVGFMGYSENVPLGGAVYVYGLDNDSWQFERSIVPEDPAQRGVFGSSLATSGDRLLVSAYGDATNGDFAGAAYLFEFDGASWLERAKLVPADGRRWDYFGSTLAITDATFVAGSSSADGPGTNAGRAWLYTDYPLAIPAPDHFSGFEDGRILGNVLADNGAGPDAHPDGSPVFASVVDDRAAAGAGGRVSIQADGAFEFDPLPDAFGTATFDYEIRNLYGASATGEVSIELAPVNDRPSFSAPALTEALEDSGAVSFPAWASFNAGAENEVQNPLEYVVVDVADPSLFAELPTITPEGALSWTPAADANGSSALTVVVRDDGGTANGGADLSDPRAFTIAIGPVNDPPRMEHADRVSHVQDLPYRASWARQLRPGPPDEASQRVTFELVSNSNADLFETQPLVSSNGVLSFTPRPGLIGNAQLQFVASDDGGTADGGVDRRVIDLLVRVLPQSLGVDLALDKTSGAHYATPGGEVSYLILVENHGPGPVQAARVVDVPPERLSGVTWTCVASRAARCGVESGTGSIDVLVDVPAGENVAFVLDGILGNADYDPITNEAFVLVPDVVAEIDPSNNIDRDTDRVGLFADSMETEEP